MLDRARQEIRDEVGRRTKNELPWRECSLD